MNPLPAILFMGIAALLAGCEQKRNEPSPTDKYHIRMCFEKRPDVIWTTPERPVSDQYGFVLKLADGREVRISGDIIIQELK